MLLIVNVAGDRGGDVVKGQEDAESRVRPGLSARFLEFVISGSRFFGVFWLSTVNRESRIRSRLYFNP